MRECENVRMKEDYIIFLPLAQLVNDADTGCEAQTTTSS